MVSPAVDFVCIGGLSLAVCLGLWLFGEVPFDQQVPALLTYALTVGITWPHFLSAYRLLYANRESVFTYRVASIYFPAALIAYGVFALTQVPDPTHVQILSLTAGVYLARHYTGQTWGMMASFAHVSEARFLDSERRWCQLSLHLIMLWHVVWALAQSIERLAPAVASYAEWLDARVDPLAYLSFALGLYGLGQMTRRLGRVPDPRVIVPWLALYSWYALLRKDPTSLVVVQLSHALQYLIFPLRIEENRSEVGGPLPYVDPKRALYWFVGLVAVGFAAFAGVPMLFRLAYADAGGSGELGVAFTSVFISFVNIHHYFVDGCLYKLRNPAVRRDLFAHLAPKPSAA